MLAVIIVRCHPPSCVHLEMTNFRDSSSTRSEDVDIKSKEINARLIT